MAWSKESRHKRGYGRDHEKMRAHLMSTVILCELCTEAGRVTAGTIADHIKPLAKGGTSDRDNYRLLCKDCHDRVTLEQFGKKPKARISIDGWPEE